MATELLRLRPMAFITMWRVGDMRCVLVLDSGTRELRLLDGALVVRRQPLTGDISPATVAAEWQGTLSA